jgi:pimeloyl-[acyl-carrier protein] methyl ester esterase
MKAHWTRTPGNGQVILFLNGWGMDPTTLSHAQVPVGWDLLMLYDYRDLHLPADVAQCMASYPTVILVAWSMGVWAARKLAPQAARLAGSLAINGTPHPIHDELGIPRALYKATVASYSEQSRQSFYRRMCGAAPALQRFMAASPARSLADQHEELAAIETFSADSHAPGFPFLSAWVGLRDRIVPPENQRRFWEQRTRYQTLEMPHFPFFHVQWEELIAHARTR